MRPRPHPRKGAQHVCDENQSACLAGNPDKPRQTKSTSQAVAPLPATIKVIGIVQQQM